MRVHFFVLVLHRAETDLLRRNWTFAGGLVPPFLRHIKGAWQPGEESETYLSNADLRNGTHFCLALCWKLLSTTILLFVVFVIQLLLCEELTKKMITIPQRNEALLLHGQKLFFAKSYWVLRTWYRTTSPILLDDDWGGQFQEDPYCLTLSDLIRQPTVLWVLSVQPKTFFLFFIIYCIAWNGSRFPFALLARALW